MENPIVRVCREQAFTRSQLSILCDCDRSLIAHIESGTAKKLSQKILTALVQLGYDAEELTAQYNAFRASLLAEIRAKLGTA